jgi:ADP-heptose:LPS heptosyltransferase
MDTSNHKNPINPGSDKILIVRTDRLGDVVLTLPMARAIKKVLPNARVTFLDSEYTQPIIERCPDVDEVRTIDSKTSFWKMIRKFRGFEVAFFPSPRFQLALAAFIARVPKRIGTGYRWYSFLFPDKIYEHRKTAEHHEAEYNLRMLASIGISADAGELPNIKLQSLEIQFVDRWIVEQLGTANAKFAVLHITSGGSTQPWPVQKFIDVGRGLAEKYNMKIVLTGVDADANIIGITLASMGTGRTVFFVGHPLSELAALMERASIVITIGTGPGHLAAALGAPTVGIFPLPKAISKERWGFRGSRVINLSPNPIAGCPDCQNCTCMERIDTENVMNAVNTLLLEKKPANT